jgi:hypothetical protein
VLDCIYVIKINLTLPTGLCGVFITIALVLSVILASIEALSITQSFADFAPFFCFSKEILS